MDAVPEKYRDLLSDEVKAFAVISTISKDNTPIMAPIWFLTEGEHLIFLTSANSAKGKNIKVRPQVGLIIMQEGHHLRYIEVRGTVVDTLEVTDDFRNKLSLKYTGKGISEPAAPDWVLFKVKPQKILAFDYS
jgi:general stress protein 26